MEISSKADDRPRGLHARDRKKIWDTRNLNKCSMQDEATTTRKRQAQTRLNYCTRNTIILGVLYVKNTELTY